MIDREKLNRECDETERNVLSKITEAFEAGFDEVRAYDGGDLNITSFTSSPPRAEVIPHYAVQGFGETPDDALADWQENLNKQPQAGRVLFWRVRPQMDWSRNFATQKTIWKVYSRFSVDGPR